MPAASTAVAWTNTSLLPSSGAMNPKPLVVLKNFTVPTVMTAPYSSAFHSARYTPVARRNSVISLGSWLSRPSALYASKEQQCASSDGRRRVACAIHGFWDFFNEISGPGPA